MQDIKSKEIKIVKVKDLKRKEKNRNHHPQEQIDRLAELIKYHGFRNPVIVSNQSGEIVAGNGRFLAAIRAGLKEIPVIFQDFDSPEAEYSYHVADNGISLWAELDMAGINSDIGDLGPDFDINMLGIQDFTLDVAEKDFEGDPDEVPEVVEPVAKLGQIYQLGEHRLMCGDSTDEATVSQLMSGEKADMVFTDPPYGVDYEGGAFSKRTKLANDHKETNIYEAILPVLFNNTIDKASFYVWHAAGYADMASHIVNNKMQIRSQIIWNKNQAQFGALSAQYKQKHEPCFYCFKKGHAPNWYGPTNEVTVWDIKRESKNEFHPTQKPVEIIERALANSSKPKDIILDLFGGSGSTLIGCEKTNRRNMSMELDPHYVDVIIARWEKFTGKKAELLNG